MIDQSTETSKAKYTIDYTGYKARIITAGEIAKITNNTTWDENKSTSYFYFDSNTSTLSNTCKSGNTSGCKYGWLYDRTGTTCKNVGCLNNSDTELLGYWTVSSASSATNMAWFVSSNGIVTNNIGFSMVGCGIRPVIEVDKSLLN